jgi:hypothetical protein
MVASHIESQRTSKGQFIAAGMGAFLVQRHEEAALHFWSIDAPNDVVCGWEWMVTR